jgi:cell division protease FtsH
MRVPGVDPVHKVTIIPRGSTLGVTYLLPEEDKHNRTKEFFLGQLAVAYGGRVAEELVFGAEKVTSGAFGDIQMATENARRMVTQLGMSEVVGPIAIGDREHEVFLGREITQRREVSEKTAELVDTEVKRILDEAYDRAHGILSKELQILHAVAEALLDRETLDRGEVELLMAGKELPEKAPPTTSLTPDTRQEKPTASADARPALGTPPPEPAGA